MNIINCLFAIWSDPY